MILLTLGPINAQRYKVEIFAILFLIAVGYGIYIKYKSLKFRAE